MTRQNTSDATRIIGAIAGAQLLWTGLRAAKFHHLIAMGLGGYLLARALATPSQRQLDEMTDAELELATAPDLGDQPSIEVEEDPVDAASWASFPASDPPSHSPRPVS